MRDQNIVDDRRSILRSWHGIAEMKAFKASLYNQVKCELTCTFLEYCPKSNEHDSGRKSGMNRTVRAASKRKGFIVLHACDQHLVLGDTSLARYHLRLRVSETDPPEPSLTNEATEQKSLTPKNRLITDRYCSRILATFSNSQNRFRPSFALICSSVCRIR